MEKTSDELEQERKDAETEGDSTERLDPEDAGEVEVIEYE